MDYPKVPAAEVTLRREKLGLTINRICRLLRISEPTWKRWERETSAPAFVHFLLLYLEAGAPLPTTAVKSMARTLSDDPRERFMAKVTPGENGHLLWTARDRFKLNGENVRPRKAAWFFAHGIIPENDVLTTCGRGDCVAPAHLKLGKRSGRHKGIGAATKSAILLELRRGKKTGAEIATKYEVSPGTVSALKKLVGRE